MSFFFFFRRIYITNLLNYWHPKFRDLHIFFFWPLWLLLAIYFWFALHIFGILMIFHPCAPSNCYKEITYHHGLHFYYSSPLPLPTFTFMMTVASWKCQWVSEFMGLVGQRSTRVTFSTLRREWEFLLFNPPPWDETRIFLTLDLRLQDEIEKNSFSI